MSTHFSLWSIIQFQPAFPTAMANVVLSDTTKTTILTWWNCCCFDYSSLIHWKANTPESESQAVRHKGSGGQHLSDPSSQVVKPRNMRLIQHSASKLLLIISELMQDIRQPIVLHSLPQRAQQKIPEFSQQPECPFSCQSLTQIFTEIHLETVLVSPCHYLSGCSRTSHIWELKRKTQY